MTIEADREEMSKLIQRIEPLEKERDSMAELGLWEQVVDIDAEIKPLRDRYNMLIDKIIQRTRGIHKPCTPRASGSSWSGKRGEQHNVKILLLL